MNHQAAKVVHAVTDEDAGQSTAYDGVLVLVFACPGCGFVDSRHEDGESPSPA